MKQLLMMFCCLGIAIQAYNQTYQLKGKIVSSSKEPIIGATVLLQKLEDSTQKYPTVTNSHGDFTLSLSAGKYMLTTWAFNYAKHVQQIVLQKDADLGMITLKDDIKQLSTIQIQGEKSAFEMKTDRKVFNVGKDILSKGGNANDILNNVPSVNVDIQGNVSLRDNKNVRIYINGKPSMLTQNNGLAQVPAANIEKIEIITNPSSAYEAQGSGGIINIILKKNASLGFNASLQAGIASPKNTNANVNASYKTEKVNLFANVGYRDQSLLFVEHIERINKNPYNKLSQLNRADLQVDNVNLFVGTDYYINDKNTLTASYYRTKVHNDNTTGYFYNYFGQHGQLDSTIHRFEDYKEPQIFNELELSYVKTFKQADRKWTTYLQYDFWNDDENQRILEAKPETGAAATHIVTRDIESSKDLYLQSDYKLPLKVGMLEMGVRGQWRAIRSEYSASQDGELLAGNNNKLFYDEDIYAAYTQYGTKWKNLTVQAGLRSELSSIKISDRALTLNKSKNYINLFPTLHLQYSFPKDWSLQTSYSRRINRPRFWQLNTFAGLSDQRFLQRGNPDINPMYTNVVEVGLLKKVGTFTINPGLYYQYTTNYFDAVIEPQSDGTFVRTWANMGRENRYGFDVTTTYNPFTWWRLSWDVNWYSFNQRGEYAGKIYEAESTTWFTTVRSSLRFPKLVNIDASVNYRGKKQEVQVNVDAQYRANIGMSKDLFGDKLSLSFSVNNIFNSNIQVGSMDVEDYSLYSKSQNVGVIFTGTAVYRFNRKKGQADRMPTAK
ncbi:outer membrane receptor protein involved in Fe transport [Chitinophaga skermanii]|uniref:Outer membrane receptor protein involved in Fe transport n=1 Tax=Chitinophaga skermanii TaxID=331697 RepID=A0A327QDG6_9BACT|nr:TonB-dependent receptor [Chitinophaga skermanii]RAJ02351.1 outer membrane receptor protein involved in Fe transport [Chitinophaga skermanii]